MPTKSPEDFRGPVQQGADAADDGFSDGPPGVQPCPLKKRISIQLLGDGDAPVANEAYRITFPGGKVLEGKLDARGRAQHDDVGKPGKIAFPDRDASAVEPGAGTVEPGKLNSFRCKGTAAEVRLQFFDGEEPRANQVWVLTVDGVRLCGTTDAQGILTAKLPAGATGAALVIGPDDAKYDLEIGALTPLEQPAGVARRLANLGFAPDSAGGEAALGEALRAFQRYAGLKETGTADDATKAKLRTLHDEVGALPAAAPAKPSAEPEGEQPSSDGAYDPEFGAWDDEAVAS